MKNKCDFKSLLVFLGMFIGIGVQAQSITSVTTTPTPIPGGSTFTVTVLISGMSSSGTKIYDITVTCSECIPINAIGTGQLQVPEGVTSGEIVINGSTDPFTAPNRTGTVAISVTATGQGGNYGCQPCNFNAAPPLPVELSFFKGISEEKAVKVNWQTATELNNSKFIIETSTQGEVFQRIGEIAGAGTTTEPQNYTFTHHTPSAGINYYRLKQVDFDGTFEYSKVIAINAPGSNDIFAFPNPTRDKITLQYDQSKGTGNIQLLDALGRRINANIGGYAGNYEVKLPEGLAKGTYWLKVERNGKVQTVPLVKE